jgi:hypothetical protein
MIYTVKKGNKTITIGEKFRVISNEHLSKWKIGDIITADMNSTTGKFTATGGESSYTVMLGVHVERLGTTKESLQSRVKELLKEKEDMECRIKFMEDKNIKELDERRYCRYIILEEINKDSPAADKEEVINELLDGFISGV